MVISALAAQQGNLSWGGPESPDIPEKALDSKEKSGMLSLLPPTRQDGIPLPSAHTAPIPKANPRQNSKYPARGGSGEPAEKRLSPVRVQVT